MIYVHAMDLNTFLHGCYLKSKDSLLPITRVFKLIHEYNYFENIVQGQTNLHKKE